MSFVLIKSTLPAAVALNGTFTIPYPAGTNSGSFAGAVSHSAFVEGLASLVSTSNTYTTNPSGINVITPPGFSLAFGASNITVTWLGVTPIPANSTVQFQLELVGADKLSPYTFVPLDSVVAEPVYVRYGAPLTASTTAILTTTAVADALLHTLATPFQMDIPRNLTYVSSNAGDTTQTITARGFDRYGIAMTEIVTLNGTGSVVGKKAFFIVTSYQSSALLVGNLSLGFGVVFGLPMLLNRKRFAFAENVDDATVTTGTFVVGDATAPSGITGDIRGTYAPATAPNGTHIYELLVAAPDRVSKMVQFAG